MHTNSYTFKIQRFDPDEDHTFFKSYSLQAPDSWSVLDCLNMIYETQDVTLAFRSTCESGICGACAININGRNMLSCEVKLQDIGKRTITLRPLYDFPIIRDLIVDFSTFFQGIEQIKPYIISNEDTIDYKEYEHWKGIIQTPEQRQALSGLYECINCGSCTSSCPIFWHNKEYFGPAVFLKVLRFYADSRDIDRTIRLKLINDTLKGIWHCHGIFNCVEACPKGLNPAEAIIALKRLLLKG